MCLGFQIGSVFWPSQKNALSLRLQSGTKHLLALVRKLQFPTKAAPCKQHTEKPVFTRPQGHGVVPDMDH